MPIRSRLGSSTSKFGVLTSIAFLITLICFYFISFTHEIWFLIAGYLSSLSHKGARLRYVLINLILLLLAIFFTRLAYLYIDHKVFYLTFAVVFFIVNASWYLRRPSVTHEEYYIMIFLMVTLIGISQSTQHLSLEWQIFDAILGSAIGYICVSILSLNDINSDFRAGIIPVFQALEAYCPLLIKVLFKSRSHSDKLSAEREELEYTLLDSKSDYPEWVYNVGFNPGLRAGLRFFLLNLEHITEAFFSMDYLVSLRINTAKYSIESGNTSLVDLLIRCMENNQLLIDTLIQYFESNVLENSVEDFTDDIKELEAELKHELPEHIELWEISSDYTILASFVRDVRDVRLILLQLITSLPNRVV